jgi:hypothetical protein
MSKMGSHYPFEYLKHKVMIKRKGRESNWQFDSRPLKVGNRPDFLACKWCVGGVRHCCNPSFGLATKAKGLQRCGPKGSPGVTSGTPGSVGKREGVNPHTPKATPALGDGVPVDSQNFRDRFEGSNLNGLWRSLYQ